MAEQSKIEWTDATFNCWEGCTKYSPGCENCYAEARAVRFGTVQWGPQGTRRVASESYWKQPLKWDKDAKAAGKRTKVFCASLADVFEDWQGPMVAAGKQPVYLGKDYRASAGPDDRLTMADVRKRLFDLIVGTENLDWMLLTKRPENVEPMMRQMEGWALASAWDEWVCYPDNLFNVWLGATVEDRARKGRIDILRDTPAAVRWLSLEPLLDDLSELDLRGIHWAIVGGESGHEARPFQTEWARSILRQCREAGVACFVKQLGDRPFERELSGWPDAAPGVGRISLDGDGFGNYAIRGLTEKGRVPAEWPADLRVREFPEARNA